MYNISMNVNKLFICSLLVLSIPVLIILKFGFRSIFPYINSPDNYNVKAKEPSDNSWKLFKGYACYIASPCKTSEENQKFFYWTSRAIQNNNINLCENVGVWEGGNTLYTNPHRTTVNMCRNFYFNRDALEEGDTQRFYWLEEYQYWLDIYSP